MFDRLKARELICQLHCEHGILLNVHDGKIAARAESGQIATEARNFITEHREEILAYLTTPPKESMPCAACGRVGRWMLDHMGIWVCDCYDSDSLHIWPKLADFEPDAYANGDGFLCKRGLYCAAGIYQITEQLDTAESLLDLAVAHELRTLWIMPDVALPAISGTLNEKGQEIILTETHDILLNRMKTEPKHVSSLVGRRRKPRSENIRVVIVAETIYPQERGKLQRFIIEVRDRLGVELQASPTTVGLRFLEKINERYHKRYFEKVEQADLGQALPDFKAAAQSLSWHRVPELDECNREFLVAYDKRSAFPRAAKEESFGIGQPVHQIEPEFSHLVPGLWYCHVGGLDTLDSRMPSALWPRWKNPGWLITPIVKMLMLLGCTIQIDEAIVWPVYAPVFERWVTRLWDLRQNTIWPEAVKAMMNNTIGFTINGHNMEDLTFRPDWNAMIVGSVRAAMIYNAQTVAQESGLYPVGAQIDALYYCAEHPTISGYLEKHPNSLGGYSHKWTLPMSLPIEKFAEGVVGAERLRAGGTAWDVLCSDLAWVHKLQIFNRLVEVGGKTV